MAETTGGFAIAIDGPASSGKGTVARAAAAALDFAYIDTGAMYRAVALLGEARGIPLDDGDALAALIEDMEFEFRFVDGALSIAVNGEDVSRRIRTETVGQGASAVAILPQVRGALLGTQRALAATQGVVMDGRDIGTVVLPGAQLKVYLDADLGARTRRRQLELRARGIHVEYETLKQEIADRDEQDSSRATAPLRQAEDAIYVDTTHLSPDEAAAEVVQLARARGAR